MKENECCSVRKQQELNCAMQMCKGWILANVKFFHNGMLFLRITCYTNMVLSIIS